MKWIRSALQIAGKDLRLELRTKESLNAAAAFAIVVLLLFSFAFDPAAPETREFAGGLFWLALAFAGALVFNRGFARELPNDCLDALLSSPIAPSALVIGKAVGIFITLAVIEILSLFVFGIFYDLRWWLQPVALTAVCALATWGISVIGAVFGALTLNLRLRELMLPVIVYPLLIPLLLAAIQVTETLLANQPLAGDDFLWIRVIVVFDIVFTALALLLADTILVN